jgi:hypothetical protein
MHSDEHTVLPVTRAACCVDEVWGLCLVLRLAALCGV